MIVCRIGQIMAFVLFLFSSAWLNGQTPATEPGKGEVVVKGRLIDSKTQKPVSYANVVLSKKTDNKMIAAMISDEKGRFNFEKIPFGNYALVASFIGYETITVDPVAATPKTNTVNLGTLTFSEEAKALDEVVVTGKRNDLEINIDKKVYNVDKNLTAEGGDATDVLRNIPSVDVDPQGNVSMRNNSNVTIYLDGKPSGINADNQADILQQLPSSVIDKVELITNPSSKYNPEGSGGIINIVTKKNKMAGYYGRVSVGASTPQGYNANLGLNYRRGPLTLFTNYGFRYGKFESSGYTNRNSYGTDTSYLKQTSESNPGWQSHFAQVGGDYQINNRQSIGITGMLFMGERSQNENITYNFYNARMTQTSQRTRMNESTFNPSGYNVNVNYMYKINDSGHELTANLAQSGHSHDREGSYIQRSYNELFALTDSSYQRQKADGSDTEYEIQVDYTRPINGKSKIEAGYKSAFDFKSDDQFSDRYNYATGTFAPDTLLTNLFDYNEIIHAVYTNYSGTIKNFGYQFGVRGEYTHVETQQRKAGYTPVNKEYMDLFPSMFLSQKLGGDNELQLSYTRRISRPRGRQVNPYRDVSDSLNISTGNPDLRPEYSDALEFNHIKSWDKLMLTSSIYYRYTNDVVQGIRNVEGNVSTTSYANLTSSTATGFEFITRITPVKMFDATLTLNAYYNKLMGSEANAFRDNENYTWNTKLSTNFYLPAGFVAQLSGYYNAPTITAQGRNYENYAMDLGLRKPFMNRKLMLSLSVRDLLDSRNRKSYTYGSNFEQWSESRFIGRMFIVNLSYNFGNIKPTNDKTHRNRDNGDNDMNGNGIEMSE